MKVLNIFIFIALSLAADLKAKLHEPEKNETKVCPWPEFDSIF